MRLQDAVFGTESITRSPSGLTQIREQIDAMPVAQAPRRDARKPGLVDYLWNAAAGYSPTHTRWSFADRARAEEAALLASQQQAEIAGGITDPRERAVFLTNPAKWAENTAQRYAPQVVQAGGAQVIDGMRTVDQPSFTESGDTILRRTSEGVTPVFTRQTPSISEQTAIDRIRADENQFNVAQGLKERQFQQDVSGSDRDYDLRRREADQKTSEAQRQEEQRRQTEERQRNQNLQRANVMSNAVERARAYTGSTGFWQGYDPRNRQSRVNFENIITPLKSAITFDGLMEMKANSPNGASGLGALSDYEARLLSDAVAALNVDMSEEEIKASFKEIEDYIAKMRSPPSTGSRPDRAALEAEARRRGLIR